MRRKTKNIISLAISLLLIATLGALYLWQTGEAGAVEQDESPPALTNIVLVNRSEADVVEVVFTQNGETRRLTPFDDESGDIQWAVDAGFDYVLDLFHVRNKARQAWLLNAAQKVHEDSAELQLSDFGLDPPALTMQASYADGDRLTLHIGTQNAERTQYFAMVEGDPALYLLNNMFVERMFADVEDMLDLWLPEFDFDWTHFVNISQRGREPIVLFADTANIPEHMQGIPSLTPGHLLLMQEPFPGRTPHHWAWTENIFGPLWDVSLHSVIELHPRNLADFGLQEPSLEFAHVGLGGLTRLQFGDTFTQGGVEFIYVLHQDRPHVFSIPFEPVSGLFDLNPVAIVDRFVALVSILDIYGISIDSADPANVFDIVINHSPDEGVTEISPTVNGVDVTDADFRSVYRMLIGISIDGDFEPFAPVGAPYLTITYHVERGNDIEVRFFERDASFLYVSQDGGDVQFVTSRRSVETAVREMRRLVG